MKRSDIDRATLSAPTWGERQYRSPPLRPLRPPNPPPPLRLPLRGRQTQLKVVVRLGGYLTQIERDTSMMTLLLSCFVECFSFSLCFSFALTGTMGKGAIIQAGKSPVCLAVQIPGNQKNKLNDPGGGSFRYISAPGERRRSACRSRQPSHGGSISLRCLRMTTGYTLS